MQRVTRSSKAVAKPAVPVGEGAGGFFTPGDPGTGTPATVPGYEWFNRVQEELVNVIEGAGIVLEKANDAQLHAAIIKLIQDNAPDTSALLRKQILLNSLLDSMAGGAALRVIDAIADPYADLSKVNTGASSGYHHDAANALIDNVASTTTASAAAKWNGATADHVFTADTISGGNYGNARSMYTTDTFAGDCAIRQTATGHGSGDYSVIGFYDNADHASFDPNIWFHSVIAASYSIEAQGGGILNVKEGAANVYTGSWTNGDVLSIERVGTTVYAKKNGTTIYTFASAVGATLRGVFASHKNGGTWQAQSVAWDNVGAPAAMVLTAANVVATAEPATGYLLGIIKPVDAITLGVDLTADLTKDGGTTWEAVTLEQVGTTDEGYLVVFAALTFVTSGAQTLASRWNILSAKHVKLHGTIIDAEA